MTKEELLEDISSKISDAVMVALHPQCNSRALVKVVEETAKEIYDLLNSEWHDKE